MKGFVFDLDNTLFDRYATLNEVMVRNEERVRPYLNPAYSIEQAAAHLCHTESVYIFNGGWNGIYEALVEERFFHPNRIPEKERAFDFIREQFARIAVNFPDTAQLLTALREKGYKLGIITNGPEKLQSAKIDLLGIRDYFDVIVTSGEYALKMCGDEKNETHYKPNPEIFRYTARLLGEAPEELYYVGDNPINDVQGAASAGYIPIWVSSRSPWMLGMEEYPKHVVGNIRELFRFSSEVKDIDIPPVQ